MRSALMTPVSSTVVDDLDRMNPLDMSSCASDIYPPANSSFHRPSTLGRDVQATREKILADTNRCERELNDKCREKSALTKLLEQLKKRKALAKTRRNKQHHALEALKAKSGESERALTKVRHQIKVSAAELATENKIIAQQEEIRDKMKAGALKAAIEIESIQRKMEHELAKMQATKREHLDCSRQKDALVNDIRVTKGALQLMEQRVSDLKMQTDALENILQDALRLN